MKQMFNVVHGMTKYSVNFCDEKGRAYYLTLFLSLHRSSRKNILRVLVNKQILFCHGSVQLSYARILIDSHS